MGLVLIISGDGENRTRVQNYPLKIFYKFSLFSLNQKVKIDKNFLIYPWISFADTAQKISISYPNIWHRELSIRSQQSDGSSDLGESGSKGWSKCISKCCLYFCYEVCTYNFDNVFRRRYPTSLAYFKRTICRNLNHPRPQRFA